MPNSIPCSAATYWDRGRAGQRGHTRTQRVNQRKVRPSCPDVPAAAAVEQRLRVERQRPADGVDPAEHGRQELEEQHVASCPGCLPCRFVRACVRACVCVYSVSLLPQLVMEYESMSEWGGVDARPLNAIHALLPRR